MNPIMSITCTCTHGGGGHMPACAMFVPTKEQYAEAVAERDKLRKVARTADVFLTTYDQAGGLAATRTVAADLDAALDTLSVSEGVTAVRVRPWWFKYE